jgi:Protein of unknown function (DUF3788)
MIANAFAGNLTKPTDPELAAALADAQGLWDQLLAELADEYNLVTREWSSYSTKAGWSLRLKAKQRTIVYLSPGRSCFQASFALGDRALKAARSAGLPRPVLLILEEAKRCAEGTGVRILVERKADIQVIKKLVAAKLAN